ncbi:uncharacterized protein LOC101847039 [Aplysia californica]|uniref:Uncharacterized protein LOC101847039 n=1 Tax=Aplysia californica TaxID=6500 RepID=A0ABM0JQQ1_APLCA|nr:uncharacterized protein LOC101847039 [Aplysia californica]
MTEANRLLQVAGSVSSDDSKSTAVSALSSVDATGTSPLPNIYNVTGADEGVASHRKIRADDLPSKKLQFSQWHELRRTEVKGSQLKAPRVRRGPPDRDRAFYELTDEDNEKIHHDLRGGPRQKQRDFLEDWETTKMASFTRQELHHGYQKPNLGRILGRLKSVVYLNLQDNELLDLSSYSFPCCEYINVDSNYLTSLSQLPRLPRVRYLTMRDNDLNTLSGLSGLASAPLEELHLTGNPVSFHIGYRYMVFQALPALKLLDGVARQEEDLTPPQGMEDNIKDRGCVVC